MGTTKRRRDNQLNRRGFLSLAGAASLGLSRASLAPSPPERRPNVLVIMTDDQGYGDQACLGNPLLKTPNLDRLHGESMRLTNFHVSPTCTPTRASLMTGRYSLRAGVWHTLGGLSQLRADETTMADIFAENGYRTGMFGKWHLGDNYPFRPGDRGFHEVVRHGGGGITQIPDYWGNDYFDDTYFHNGVPEKYEGYCTDVWFDEAVRFIEENRDRPWLCYIAPNVPHGPYHVPEEYVDMYRDRTDLGNAQVYGMVTHFDRCMGRLRRRLEELGLADHTILIYLTDNGATRWHREGLYNAGMRGFKGTPFEGGHRVPCFIHWPAAGWIRGRGIDSLTAHLDLLPTLVAACGLDRPDVQFDGHNLLPLLKGEAKSLPERVVITDIQRVPQPQKWRNSVVMKDHWRLVSGRQLYSLKTDPGQKKNVAGEHPDVLRELRGEYEKWWDDVSARFDETSRIVIGSERENPTTLTCFDWHWDRKQSPHNQTQIRHGVRRNGYWALDVSRTGTYDIELRRWPREANQPMRADIGTDSRFYSPGRALDIASARLQVQGQNLSKAIPEGAVSVNFRVRLEKGDTRLQTWFLTPDGEPHSGAYYVYVTGT